jgi:two-component system cell cycle response regulator DivK
MSTPIPLLIVDDDPVFAMLVRRLVASLGGELECAPTWLDTPEKPMLELGRCTPAYEPAAGKNVRRFARRGARVLWWRGLCRRRLSARNGSRVADVVKKIAVVEDNPDNRLLVRVILDSLYEVTEYETGLSALEGLQTNPPDLVLLDVSLPEIDGTEVLRRIRADPNLRNLPVIALTAHAMATDREKFLAAGFDDYVTKPIVDEDLLLDAIKSKLTAKSGL